MIKPRLLGYCLLALTLILLLSVPPKKMHRLRASLVAKALNVQTSLFDRKATHITKLEKSLLVLKEQNEALQQILKNTQLSSQNISEKNSAFVIFRDPAFWASSVLINKGMRDEDSHIEKNSPVLSNGYLIGVVEEVFETFSKVRLITDKNLQVSVKKEAKNISHAQETLDVGTLFGIASLDNRTRFRNVEGIFFSPHLQPGDELITSGLDGIFPEGLKIAHVTEVNIEMEEVTYPFKAIVSAPDLKDLKIVTILKPICPLH
jgi:rod shape-determining protein MreC